MTGNKKVWKCPTGCNMEHVSAHQVEILYRPNGWSEVDDIYLENVETGTIEDSHTIYTMFSCPVCDTILDIRTEPNRGEKCLPTKNI